MSYIETEHYRSVIEASKTTPLKKVKRNLFMNKADAKNYMIMRHVFERLRDTCGVFDGMRGAVNYARSGVPRAMKLGQAKSFDVHMVEWQMELVREGHIQPKGMLAPASIMMHIAWAITAQKYSATFRVHQATVIRRAAVNAGWLLIADLVKLEELNFPEGFANVTGSKSVTLDPKNDQEPVIE